MRLTKVIGVLKAYLEERGDVHLCAWSTEDGVAYCDPNFTLEGLMWEDGERFVGLIFEDEKTRELFDQIPDMNPKKPALKVVR